VIIIFSVGWALGTVGEAINGVGYLGAVGSMIASAIYYTYRSVLVESIDNYITKFKANSLSSKSKTGEMSQTRDNTGFAREQTYGKV
jgi:hypothetical protein